MGFRGRFFIALLVVCAAKGAWAQCCWCDAADGCDVGKVVMGYNLVGAAICESCDGLTGYMGCSHCNCYGYDDDQCPFGGNPDGKKCKKVAGKCPSPCEYYKLCDVATGNITATQIVGACHMEGETCYSNTRACSMFVVDHFAVGWNCDQGAQVGDAEWRPSENAWNTENCTCSVVDRDIVHVVGGVAAYGHCIAANSDFYVTDADKYRTTSVNDHVRYSFRRRFCRQCEPGYLPTPWPSPDDGIILRPEGTSGNWGVITCGIQVQAPDYAPGCVIDFNLPTGNVAQGACRKQCPDGFETKIDSATSVEDCQYDGYTTYTDGTGTFYIGSLDECL